MFLNYEVQMARKPWVVIGSIEIEAISFAEGHAIAQELIAERFGVTGAESYTYAKAVHVPPLSLDGVKFT